MKHPQVLLLVLVAITVPLASNPGAEETSGDILDIGHVEEVTSSLIQVPVVVAGSGDLNRLSANDLEVWIGDRRLERFRVDYLGEGTTSFAHRSGYRVAPHGQLMPAPVVRCPVSVRVPTSPMLRTMTIKGKGGKSKQVPVPIHYVWETRYIYKHIPGATPASSGSQLNRSVMSLVSINLVDEPPSPALRVVSRKKFLRLDAASYDGTQTRSTRPVVAHLVPTDFADGSFDTLAQVSVPDPGEFASAWDVTLSISSGSMTSVVWGRIEAAGNEDRLVLQDTLEIPPGGYTVVARAHNEETGETRTSRLTGKLEKPLKKRASLGPVAVFQPGGATVLRAGHALSSSGTVALGVDESLEPDRESVLLSSLCRDRAGDDELTVERTLIGAEAVTFPTTRVEPAADRCVMLADRVPADTMGEGRFLYRIRVSDSEGLVTEGQRELFVDGSPTERESIR